jgi:hypothetical protein
MNRYDRHFTVQEANQTLQALEPLIDRLMLVRDQIVTMRPELEKGLQKVLGNGGSSATKELVGLMQSVRALVQQIESHGVLVKDIDQGLFDFPAEMDGKEVFLCWRFGEPSVSYWHELDAGFAGRQSL